MFVVPWFFANFQQNHSRNSGLYIAKGMCKNLNGFFKVSISVTIEVDWLIKSNKKLQKNLLQVLWSWYKVSDKILILCHIIKKVKMFVFTWLYIPYFCTAFVFMIDTWCHSLILCNLQAQICLWLQYVIQQLWNQNIEQLHTTTTIFCYIFWFTVLWLWVFGLKGFVVAQKCP